MEAPLAIYAQRLPYSLAFFLPTMSTQEFVQREYGDHASLASIEDYEPSLRHSPAFEITSQHSGFQSPTTDSEQSDTDTTGPWSPPAWRRPASGWFNATDRLAAIQGSPSRSRETSPSCHDPDVTLPVNVPLPRSPLKRSPSPTSPVESEEQEDQAGPGQEPPASTTSQNKHNCRSPLSRFSHVI